ncbi:MAG: hypothetical protein E7J94_04790, partial [Clostridium sp.]|nr:hypothetical protein [Clostridium sp.]
ICWQHKNCHQLLHLVAKIIFIFLIVHLTGSSSERKKAACSIFKNKRLKLTTLFFLYNRDNVVVNEYYFQ